MDPITAVALATKAAFEYLTVVATHEDDVDKKQRQQILQWMLEDASFWRAAFTRHP